MKTQIPSSNSPHRPKLLDSLLRVIVIFVGVIVLSAAWDTRANETVTLQTGNNLVGCTVNGTGGNNINNQAFLQIPDSLSLNAVLYVWNCTSFNQPYYFISDTDAGGPGLGGWYDATFTVPANVVWNPGEGMLIYNPNPPTSITLAGSTAFWTTPPTNYCGCDKWSLLGTQTTNTGGTYTDVTGYGPQDGAEVATFNSTNNTLDVTAFFTNSMWNPSPPILAPGAAAFYYVPCGTNPCTPPVITSFRTNIIVCTDSNGCALMPDVTSTVDFNSPPPRSISQSIPVGTILCSNTFVTFTVTNNCGSTNCVSLVVLQSVPFVLQCAADKTVQCGSVWSFDKPIVSACCDTNPSIQIQSLFTNGTCPQYITATWLITNSCGDFTNCTQTVTVQNTNPPVFIGCYTNLIPNPGFETFSSCPSGPSQFNLAQPWFQSTLGTPDLFTACATSPQVQTPANFVGYAVPHGGQSYGGGTMYGGDASGPAASPREYMETPLVSPLIAGETYEVSFYVQLAASFRYAIDNVGAYFSVGPLLNGSTYGSITVTPQVRNPAGTYLASTTSWMRISGTFVASGLEDHVTIGNFYDDFNSPGLVVGGTYGYAFGSYYYLDDVEVHQMCPTNKIVNCGAPVIFDTPVAFDPCSGMYVQPIVVSTVSDGQCPQHTTRTWSAVNACGATAFFTQTVTVMNNGNTPVISVPSNLVVYSCIPTNVNFSVTASNACCTNTSVVCMPAPNSVFQLGTTLVTCVATDCCGNKATNFFNVTVLTDSIPPVVLYCPTNITICSSNGCAVLSNYTHLVIATDNSGSWTVTQSPSPGQTICSNMTLTFTVKDACGNTTNCSALATLINCCYTPPKGMVLWLTFDETVGATCFNSMGGNNGTRYYNISSQVKTVAKANNVGPLRTLGQYVDNCLRFSGSSNVVIVPSYSRIAFTTGDFSMDAWVKWSGGSGIQTIVDKHGGTVFSLRGYSWQLNNGIPIFVMDAGFGAHAVFTSGATPLPVNVWTHLAVTIQRHSNTGLKFYLNGTAVSSFNPTSLTASLNNSSDLWVGNSPPNNAPFNGYLDELEIFNRALTATEVSGLFSAGNHGKCRPSLSLPLPAPICANSNSITVKGTICNNGSLPATFSYSFSTLSPPLVGIAGAVNWPAGNYFSPNPGSVSIPAHQCVDVYFTIKRPSTLSSFPWPPNSQQVACYEMTVQNLSQPDGELISTLGEIVVDYGCLQPAPHGNTGPIVTNRIFIGGGTTTNVVFGIANPTGTPFTFHPQISVLDDTMQPETNIVSLNGMPPGTPVNLTVPLAGNQVTNISVALNFTDVQPWTAYCVVLSLDIGPGGSLVPADSFTIRNFDPPTVGPAVFLDSTNGQAVISWDMINTDWSLSSIPDLNNTNWVPLNLPILPQPDGSQGVTLPTTNHAQFFRLNQ